MQPVRVACASSCQLYRHSALTRTSAVEPRRYAHHRVGSRKSVVEHCQQHGLSAAARASVYAYALGVHVLALYHPVEYPYTVECLHHVCLWCLVCLAANFVGRFAPSPQVIVNAYRAHACQCAQSQLLHLAVASVAEVSVGAYYQRMLSLARRGVDRAAHCVAVRCLQSEVLHGISVKLPYLRVFGFRP